MNAPKLFLGLALLSVAAWLTHGALTSDDEATAAGSRSGGRPEGEESGARRVLTTAPDVARAFGVARTSFLPEGWDGERPEADAASDLSWREEKLLEKFREEGFRGLGNSSVLLSPDLKPGGRKKPGAAPGRGR